MPNDQPKDDEPKAPQVGKTYRGQPNAPFQTPADVQARRDATRPYDVEGAVNLGTYCAMRGFRDPVMQASLRAFTIVDRARPEAWDEIFKRHHGVADAGDEGAKP